MEGLECSERAKNLINRKIGILYFEAIPRKIPQLQENIYFFALKNIFRGKKKSHKYNRFKRSKS